MTKISISGTVYELSEATQRATNGDLRTMGVVSEAVLGVRVTLDFMNKTIDRIQTANGEHAMTTAEAWSDMDYLATMHGLVYLARRYAGEKVTFEEAGEFVQSEVELVNDPVPKVEAELPKAPAPEPEPSPE